MSERRINQVRLTKVDPHSAALRIERYEIEEGSSMCLYWSTDGWAYRPLSLIGARKRIQARIKEGWQVAAAG